MVQYNAIIDEDETEPNLFDVEIEDTFNPFGNYAILHIKDDGGERYEEYTRGTRVDLYHREPMFGGELSISSGETETVNSGETLTVSSVLNSGEFLNAGTVETGEQDLGELRFTGFVVERREYEENGADILEVECYTFDQFLRGTKVTTNTEDLTLFETLETIIEEDTPVSWNANKVEVGDPQTLTRNYRGETVENTIIELSHKSENEEFGVDPNLEFFFRPRESSNSPRDIDNTQWFHHDIPEEGKEAVNEVTVYFNDGEESVTVDKGDDKLDQQDSLGLESPPENRLEKSFPDITDLDDARDKGEQILQERQASQTGEVVTYGLEGARPGDLINIEIDSRGINDEFVIAGLQYSWADDETTVTIIRKTGYQDDVLVRIADAVEKIELQGANRDGIENRVTETSVGIIVDATADVETKTFAESRITNTARNKLRDAWSREQTIQITELAVGDDGSNLSRSNTSLENEVNRITVDKTLEGSTEVSYSGEVEVADVREVGLFDSDGDMVTRAVGEFEQSGLEMTSVDMSVSVRNDPTISRGLFTTSGLESTRDVLADNDPSLPAQYLYGSGGTDPQESDTELDNPINPPLSLFRTLLQDAGTTESWNDITELPPSEPVYIENDELRLAQTCWLVEGEDHGDGGFISSDADYSGGEAFSIDRELGVVTFTFTPNYTIPEDELVLVVREGPTEYDGDISYRIGNNEDILSIPSSTTIDWFEYTLLGNEELPAGESVQVTAEMLDDPAGETYTVDLIGVYDSRFPVNIDNQVHEPDGYLDGPELYPDVTEVAFTRETTRRPITVGELSQTWTDTTGNQYLELSNDGETFIRYENTDNATVEFEEGSSQLEARIGLSRYPINQDPQNATPRYGYNGQIVSDHDLFGNPGGIIADGVGEATVQTTISPGTATGEDVREAGQLSDDDTLLTRSVMAEFTIDDLMRVISSESITWRNP